MARAKKRPQPVRWSEGGRTRSRQFDQQGDADAFRTELKRRKQLGTLAPTILDSQQTLMEFVEGEWWPRHVMRKTEHTQRRYLEVWGTHMAGRIGSYRLTEIDSILVEDFLAEMDDADVGKPTQLIAINLLSNILQRALRRKLIPENPAQHVEKPKQAPRKPVVPLAPAVVEAIREQMLGMWESERRGSGRSHEDLEWWRHRNALMVSILAYAGLRPGELQRARWRDLNGRSLHVFATKTSKARDVDLLAPLVADLAAWRMRCGRPAADALIVPTYDGDGWQRHDWGNWRSRVYKPAAIAAGVTGDMSPYRLRDSFVSLLLWAGEDPVYAADQAGHSLRTQSDHYAGVMRDLRGQPRVPADEAIQRARSGRSEADSDVISGT